MDRALYVAMSGAEQIMLAQTVNAQNLANVGTTGFKADLMMMQSRPVMGAGLPTRVYAEAQGRGVDFSSGAIVPTGRELDVAVKGDGWFAVQTPDGGEAYTRAGNLTIAPIGGLLVTAAGLPVLGNGGPIALPQAEKLEIGVDGTISIRPVGQDPKTLVAVDRIKLVKPPVEDLARGLDGLMRRKDGELAVADATVTVASGSLESSNVNAVEAMVNMITLARQFELHIKTMKASGENDTASARLMQMN